jgi:hypothetical protein
MSEKNCVCGYAIGHPLVSKCTCKEWQGLSDEEVKGACKNSDEGFNVSAFRQGVNWAEQKLKEKNNKQ